MLRKKIMSLFKSNRAEDYYKATRVKNVCRGGKDPKKKKKHTRKKYNKNQMITQLQM